MTLLPYKSHDALDVRNSLLLKQHDIRQFTLFIAQLAPATKRPRCTTARASLLLN